MKNRITAVMKNDKYIELSPDWPYEVVKYESGKIKLKDIPRIYPADDFKLQRDGKPITYSDLEKERDDEDKITIADFIQTTAIVIVIICIFIVGLFFFAIGYFLSKFIIGYVFLVIACAIWVADFYIMDKFGR